MIKLRDLLSFSPIDVLVKTADHKSYYAILQELKDKEIYNMIIDIHDTENMSDFLKAVSEEIDLLQSQRARRRKLENINLFFQSPSGSVQILELQMNDFKYHYLFTSFDLETFEMEDFRYNFVNITAFRLVDTNDVFVKETLKEMEQFSRQNNMKFKTKFAVEVGKVLTTLSVLMLRPFPFHIVFITF